MDFQKGDDRGPEKPVPRVDPRWYESLVESAPDAVVLIDSDGHILLVNRQTERLFGYERVELIGKAVEMLVPEQFRAHHAVHRDGYFAEPKLRGMGEGLELSGRRRDGSQFPIEISLSPIQTESGLLVTAAIRDATERRRANEKFRALLESAPDAMVIIDERGLIRLVNAQAKRVFGYQSEALIGKRVEVLIPERLRDRHAGHRTDYFTAPKVRGMGEGLELWGRRKDGQEFPIEISLSPMETEDGIWATAAVRDISQQKRERDAAVRLAAIVESSNDAIIGKDLEGRITSWNRAAEQIFGYGAQDAIGRDVTILFPPERLHEEQQILERVRQGAQIQHFETQRVAADGRLIEMSLTISPIRDALGRVVGASTIGRDVGERKRANELFRALLETAPDAMVIIDRAGLINLVNAQTERLFGYSREHLIGQPVEVLIPERLRGRHADHRAGYFAGPKLREMGAGLELWGLRSNGEEFAIEISLSPMNIEGELLATAAVRDISERKAVERKLAKYADDLTRSNRDLEQFAYVASHDLQAPLRSVIGFSQLLRKKYDPQFDDDGREFLHYVESSARHMQELINGLLAFSRVGSQGADFSEVDAEAVMAGVITHLSATIQERNARITHDPLPRVRASKIEFNQLLQNLIVNGLKFQPGESPRVHVSARREGSHWHFSVQDWGIGISPEHQERIFQIFQRLHPPETYEGTGIGLAVCQKIVQRHGGRIWVESTAGEGATFHFTLAAE